MAVTENSGQGAPPGVNEARLAYIEPRRDSVMYRRFGPVAVGAGLLLALATFVIFAGFTPIIPTTGVVLTLLLGDVIVVAIVLSLIVIELTRLRAARRASRAGARLHTRLIALFSLVAATPAAVTAVVATVSVEWAINPAFMRGLNDFASEASRTSQAYREAQCQSLLRDADLTAGDLSRSARLLKTDPTLLQSYLDQRAQALGFAVAAIVTPDGKVTSSATNSDSRLIARPQASDFADSDNRRPFCALLNAGGAFIALRPIEGLEHSYLYAGRALDPIDERFAKDSRAFSETFTLFLTHRRNIELGFGIVFVMLTLTLLISAVWMGLTFANYLVGPIRRLIRATDEVASGNLYVQVPTHKSEGDLGHLGDTFNKMTAELRHQHRSLTAANALLEERRTFIEAALSGVPAGVIGVDGEGVVGVCNAAAERLVGAAPAMLKGRPIGEASPRLGEILTEARSGRSRLHQAQATLQVGGRERLINVRVTGDPTKTDSGMVITLDDISELVAAQRSAAWADVARRIAHEIKNPLTPIQLSAERLKRRYGRNIVEGKEIFDQCTDTIIRQVDDIKRMVDEFSNFARMPKARMLRDDLTDCARQALFLARVGRADITFEDDLPAEPIWAEFDRRLISQALTNVLKNAGEGIDARGISDEPGHIRLSLAVDSSGVARISVRDNGKGFPREDRLKLLEPYVTTRAEGTGLGLPIVSKIFEDHGGTVELLDGLKRADGGVGAEVLMSFPLRLAPESAASDTISAAS
jgi:two-component system, NtrC family, nitrogen regulation sensor histidine kinase NtrY